MKGVLFSFVFYLLFISQSFSQPQAKLQNNLPGFGINSELNETQIKNKSIHTGVTLHYYQRSLIQTNEASGNHSSANPFAYFESLSVHNVETGNTNDGKFVPFRGMVIGYNYVCITRGAWQWESGRLKYFFSSRLIGSLKAIIKNFEFKRLELAVNFKL